MNQAIFNFWASVVYCGFLSLILFGFLWWFLGQPTTFAGIIALEWFWYSAQHFFDEEN